MSSEHAPARQRFAFSIYEFCEMHSISRSKFYELRREGRAPDIANANGKQIITIEAAARWRKAMERRARQSRARGGEAAA
jgi:predicted site-specific integrase-resolvase